MNDHMTHDELVLARWLAGVAGHDADARAEVWTEMCDGATAQEMIDAALTEDGAP